MEEGARSEMGSPLGATRLNSSRERRGAVLSRIVYCDSKSQPGQSARGASMFLRPPTSLTTALVFEAGASQRLAAFGVGVTGAAMAEVASEPDGTSPSRAPNRPRARRSSSSLRSAPRVLTFQPRPSAGSGARLTGPSTRRSASTATHPDRVPSRTAPSRQRARARHSRATTHPSHHAGFAGDVVDDGTTSRRHLADASEDALLALDPEAFAGPGVAARETDDAATAAAVAAAGAELDAFLASTANRMRITRMQSEGCVGAADERAPPEEAFAEVLARRDRAKAAIGELARRVEDVQRELNALDEEEDLEIEAEASLMREEEEEKTEELSALLRRRRRAATTRGRSTPARPSLSRRLRSRSPQEPARRARRSRTRSGERQERLPSWRLSAISPRRVCRASGGSWRVSSPRCSARGGRCTKPTESAKALRRGRSTDAGTTPRRTEGRARGRRRRPPRRIRARTVAFSRRISNLRNGRRRGGAPPGTTVGAREGARRARGTLAFVAARVARTLREKLVLIQTAVADAKRFEKTKHEDDVRRLLELKRSTDAVFASVSRAVAVKKAARDKKARRRAEEAAALLARGENPHVAFRRRDGSPRRRARRASGGTRTSPAWQK